MRLLLLVGVIGTLALVRRLLRRPVHARQAPPQARVTLKGEQLRTHGADEISVLSWNILADCFAMGNRMPHVHPDHLAWSHRRPLIVQELLDIDADLVCLQEVDTKRWSELLANSGLASVYQGLLQEKKGEGSGAANAILYRPGRLELQWSEHRSRTMLASFRFLDSYGIQQILYVVNCHLEGSPYRPNDRVSQMKSSLQRLQQCQQQQQQQAGGAPPRDCTVVVCGDFNSGRAESVWRLLYRGRLEAGSTDPHLPHVEVTQATVAHPYLLQDAYVTAGVDLPFTRKTPMLGSTLDYVFASSDMDVSAVYWPLEVRRFSDDQLSRYSLPNHVHPSDHLPVGAVLRLKQPSAAAHRLFHAEQQQQLLEAGGTGEALTNGQL